MGKVLNNMFYFGNSRVGFGNIRKINQKLFGFDADYQAVLNYATTEGYTLPSSAQQILQNQLVLDLKADGIWSELDHFSVFATDGDDDFSLIDWIRLTTLTAVNSPTFTTDVGWTGTGSNSYLDTSLNLSGGGLNYNQNSSAFGCWVHTPDAQNFRRYMGLSNSNHKIGQNGDHRVQDANSEALQFQVTAGLIHVDRASSTAREDFQNGSSLRSFTEPSIAIASGNLRILELADGSGDSLSTVSATFAGASLASKASDLYSALNTYITSL